MTTQVDQLFGPSHWDGMNYQSLFEYYQGKDWKKGLEIGFAWAMSAKAFLDATSGTLLSLDMNDSMDKAKDMQVYGDRWSLLLGDSSTLMSKLTGKYDYIYIDGDHTYDGVKKDLWEAPRLLADGGTIICDDYDNAESIRTAVEEFNKKFGFHIEGKVPMNNNGAVILCA